MKDLINIVNDDLQLPADSYEPPLLEVHEFVVEKGFAASSDDWNPGTW
jgi:hypothetical protein